MTHADRDKPRGKTVELDDVSLYYEEFGAGYPLLLLHGGLESSRTWLHLIPNLASEFRVITVDTRGHGHSTNPAGRLAYPRIASDFAAVIEAVATDPPYVVGWSDGGQHALHLALRYPQYVRAFVAGAADYHPTPETQGWVRDFFGIDALGQPDLTQVERMLGESYPRFRAMHAGGDEHWRTLVTQTAQLWLDYPGLSDAEFGGITRPALVMVGDRDGDVPVEAAISMYRTLPNADLAVCPHANHSIPWRRTGWFLDSVREFLRRH
ncbi:MAG TPA: alpha/beta hydrolase [Thermomicrobiaceae bacterium]|nr:alpha/beta hydrolase [Thermomicrobiaceae bacterium]